MLVRLQKILADSGITSRRKAEELIRNGRVTINGLVVTRLGTKADPNKDSIKVDNQAIQKHSSKLYIMLNKPRGCVSTLSDPEGRKTIADLFRDIPTRLYPIGRLDYDTEGLMILTNDGTIAQLLQHPRHNISRTYLVKVKGLPERSVLNNLTSIQLDGRPVGKLKLRVHKKTTQNTWIELTIWEGRNRQIKRMFEAIRYPALKIKRIGFGPLKLDRNLKPGAYRFLTGGEVKMLNYILSQRSN
jgi:pseudouridine synthase